MIRLALTLLLMASPLWGCATQHDNEMLVRRALQERNAAYSRLANAIARYCSLGNESLESSQSCILEKLTILRSEQARQAPGLAGLSITPPPSLNRSSPHEVASVSCARTRIGTTCQRIPPAVAQTDLN
jgi:hypothetical protein